MDGGNLMPYTPTRFYIGQPGTTEETLYTIPSGQSAIIKQILLTNVTATAATISLSLVPNGQTAVDSNRILKDYNVAANDVVTIDLTQVLNSDDFISAIQATASAITVTISGVLI
jgi:hypothetical protein